MHHALLRSVSPVLSPRADLGVALLSVALLSATSIGCANVTQGGPPASLASLEGDPHLAVRIEAGSVWASARPWSEPRRAWRIPARGRTEQISLRALPGGGFEVTFRQDGVTWRGELDAGRAPRASLTAVGVTPTRGDSLAAEAAMSASR